MEKSIFFLSIVFLLFAGCQLQRETIKQENSSIADNTKTSLDRDGSYYGMLPCADCDGIKTIIKLNRNYTYELKIMYAGKDENVFELAGTFSWNEEGNRITLNNSEMRNNSFFVGENFIRQLDAEGNQITGDLADKYVLRKIVPEIINKYWKLIELNGKKVLHNEKNKREPHMILKIDENIVHGSGGCNTFNGKFELEERNRITFSKIASTLMACENMETEQEFFKIFEMADNYFLNGDTLFLHKGKIAPLAKFEAVYFK